MGGDVTPPRLPGRIIGVGMVGTKGNGNDDLPSLFGSGLRTRCVLVILTIDVIMTGDRN